MAKLILHIGMQKTGSSAIQSSLAASSGNGFIYPLLSDTRFKPPKHTEALVQMFSSNSAEIAQQFRYAGKQLGPGAEAETRLRKAAADAGDGIVILSSEGATSYLAREDVQALRRFAEQLFDDIRIIGYIREPFDSISANFQTRVKGRRLAEFTPRYKRLRPRFEIWDDVFGADRVQLWKYDRKAFPNGDIVEHFCAEVGLPELASADANVTPSKPGVSAQYRLNKAIAEDEVGDVKLLNRVRKVILRNFPHQDWPKFRLSPSVVAPLLEKAREDIGWMEQRVGASLMSDRQPQSTDVRNEEDLLEIDPRALAILQNLAESLAPEGKRLLLRALRD